MSLKEFLEKHDYAATTEGGYQWLRKALHPADSTIKAPRAPSHGTRPTATQECTVTFQVDAPTADPDEPTAPWRLGLFLKNDVLCPLQVFKANETLNHPERTWFTCINQCFSGGIQPVAHDRPVDEFRQLVNSLRAAAEQYRLNALSVTATFIGATLTDQGSVISAQMADAHQDLSTHEVHQQVVRSGVSIPGVLLPQLVPSSDSMVMGAAPYVTRAKEGVYVPYKIQCPGVWRSTDDLRRVCRAETAMENKLSAWHDFNALSYPDGNMDPDETPGIWYAPGDDNLSATWFTGLARTTSFRVTYRISIEVMTRPDSVLAPFCELPALPDEHALAMYYEIASRMKDGYPAVDNEKSTLLTKIREIARGIWDITSPALALAVPGAGPILKAAVDYGVPALGQVVKAVRKRGRQKALRNKAVVQLVSTPARLPKRMTKIERQAVSMARSAMERAVPQAAPVKAQMVGGRLHITRPKKKN